MNPFRMIAAVAFAALLTACSSAPLLYKISDPETVRVLEGVTVKAEVKQRTRNTTLTSTVATGAAANNVGNAKVGVLALAVNLLDSHAEAEGSWYMNLVVLDDKTQQEETVVFKRLIQNRIAPDPGDRVRIIFRNDESKSIANLTKYPTLDAHTR